mmetsp:Transcript_18967/g.26260  ORF Transcript_18967/g.26260 Transcript_18967/m.26260 type:complete len:84 (+) Transcript_18967:621-872(+)
MFLNGGFASVKILLKNIISIAKHLVDLMMGMTCNPKYNMMERKLEYGCTAKTGQLLERVRYLNWCLIRKLLRMNTALLGSEKE